MQTGSSVFAVKSSNINTHPKYDSRISQWVKCRDAFEGEDKIKSKGETYLPRLSGQSDEEYKKYKYRALFYSITAKSLSALTGMAVSADRKLAYPKTMDSYFVGEDQSSFDEVLMTTLNEVFLQGRIGILIDSPQDGGKPYTALYKAEDILNWRTDSSGKLIYILLREEYEVELEDGQINVEIRHIELRLTNGEYTQQTFIGNNKNDSISFTPTFSGKTLNYIPFTVIHPNGLGMVDCKPPMLDIANINISHYLSSADLEHGRHFTGLPTPVITGSDSQGALHIGSTQFIVLPDKGSDAKYLEFTGQGLQSLEKAMQDKQGLLATMSARLLDNSSRGSEAAEAVKLRYSSETASLKTVVESVNKGLQIVYSRIASMIRESASDVSIILGTDFMESQLTPAEMTALFDGYINGAIGVRTLVFNLRKGRRLNPLESDESIISELVKISLDKKAELNSKPAVKPQNQE